MATVKIDRFGGIVPRTAPSLLADGMATVAHNCRLKSGKLVPLRAPSVVDGAVNTVYRENGLGSAARANSVYCWKHTLADGTVRTDFIAFPGRVYFAHGNIADDEYDRVFVTGETGVSFVASNGAKFDDCPAVYLFDRRNNSIIRHCIVKEPLNVPRCTPDAEPDENSLTYAYFFASWYDRFGYESPASLPSRNKNYGASAYLEGRPLSYSSPASIRFQPINVPPDAAGVRIYKTNSGDETDNVQFIREFDSATIVNVGRSFAVRVDDTQAAEAMPEIEAPPADLVDMAYVPGNYYAGRMRSMPHTVLFSDVDNPTNWPTAYRYDIRDNVVKLAVTSNSVFALTDGTPFVLSGTAPESMTVASLATPAACVSEKSVVVHRNVVYFASNQGLMAIADGAAAGSSCANVTDRLFTKEQWQALNPKSCVIGVHDDALHMFFKNADGVPTAAYVLDLSEDGSTALTTHEKVATCVCVDDREDELYYFGETSTAQ